MSYQLISPEESTASKTKYDWRFWTILIVTTITVLMNLRQPAALLFTIPINLIVWLVIVWLVRSLISGIRYLFRR